MIVLEPIDTAQDLYLRCRAHTETKQLIVLSNELTGVDAYVTELPYSDGLLNGSVTLPLAQYDERIRSFRVFSVDPNNATIQQIETDGGAFYTSQEWLGVFTELVASDGIEKEIFRGLTLITSQADLDKYELYG